MNRALRVLVTLAACAVGSASWADDYPNKPVKIIVPFTAGSATDILARTVGQKLNELWNQSVVVDNRAGAGGTIGAGIVAKSPADGYTLLVHSAGQAVNPFIYPSLPYDTLKDFVQIAPLGGQPNVLVVAPSTGYKTVADLIADAKRRPGVLNFGSAGIGSGTHINGEKFKLAAAIDVVHVPYKGTPEALTDAMTGRIAYYFSPISAALPLVRDGKLLALAVSSSQTLERVAQRADRRRVGPARLRLQPVGRHVRTRRHAARGGRQAQPRRQPRAARGRRARAHDVARRGGDADERGRIRPLRARGDGRRRQSREGGGHQGAVARLSNGLRPSADC